MKERKNERKKARKKEWKKKWKEKRKRKNEWKKEIKSDSDADGSFLRNTPSPEHQPCLVSPHRTARCSTCWTEETRNLRCLSRHFTEQHGSTCIYRTAWQHLYLTSNLLHEDVPERFRKHASEVFKLPPTQDLNIYHTKHECNEASYSFSRLSSHKLQACCSSNPIFEQHNVSCLWDTFYCHYRHLAVNLSSCTQEQYANLMEYHGLKFRRFSKTHFQLTSHCACV